MTAQEAKEILINRQFILTEKYSLEKDSTIRKHMNDEFKAIDIALDALIKQVPKKVSEKSFFKPLNEIIGECPNCSNAVPLQCLYCHRCGQALDWSD